MATLVKDCCSARFFGRKIFKDLKTRFLPNKKIMCYNKIVLSKEIVWILIQYLKRQKNTLKKVNVRIFRQLPAKMSLGSLDFSGLWEHSVEMKDTRLRELLHLR